jgi:hypothetical protein
MYLMFRLLEECSHGKKSAVDWTALSKNQDEMIDPKYLPADFEFRDPSKMKKVHYQSLLEHWYTRQEDNSIETVFAFRGYWDPSSDSVIGVPDKYPGLRKQSKLTANKRQAVPKLISSSRKDTNSKAAKKTNGRQKRIGPPGIRKGDKQWQYYSGKDDEEDDANGEKNEGGDSDEEKDDDDDDDEDEEDGDEEDVDEGDEGDGEEGDEGDGEEGDEGDGEDNDRSNRRRQRGIPSRMPPKVLPFSATRTAFRGAYIAPKKNTGHLTAIEKKSMPKSEAPSKKARANARVTENDQDQMPETNNLEPAVLKRPLPYGGSQSGAPASRPSRTLVAPQFTKEKLGRKRRYPSQPPDLGPQFERPTTRSSGKRKVDDAGLQATGESSKKKGKKRAVRSGGE